MAVQGNGGARGRVGGVTGKGFMPGQSGNPRGRAKELAALAREAVGGGRDLVAFYVAVFKGDKKALGEREITLRDRMDAAEWIGTTGWGKPVPFVEEPEQGSSRKEMIADLREWADRLPPDVRRVVVDTLDTEFEAEIERGVAEMDAELRRILPEKESAETGGK